ncbi:MAG: hypothetical protein QXR62_03670 [Candidatus Bathyarchaeia archaeon]
MRLVCIFKDTNILLLGYIFSLSASFALLKISSTVRNAGLVFSSFGLGAGTIFALDMGMKIWVDRDGSTFTTAFIIKLSTALLLIPLILALNPLALPFLLMEPLTLLQDLLINQRKLRALSLSFLVSGLTKIVVALSLREDWTTIYLALCCGELMGHIVRISAAHIPSFQLKFRELRGSLSELIPLHLSMSSTTIIHLLGSGILGLIIGPDKALGFYFVAAIAGAMWSIPNYMLSLRASGARPDLGLMTLISVTAALSSPFISRILGYEEMALSVGIVALATIPTAMVYTIYGSQWREERSVKRFSILESIFRIFTIIVGAILIGPAIVGLSQMTFMLLIYTTLQSQGPFRVGWLGLNSPSEVYPPSNAPETKMNEYSSKPPGAL